MFEVVILNEKNYILAEADYVEGMKYKDIAAKYGVSINTVKSWKKRYAWSRDKKECTKKGCTQNKKGAHKKEAVAEDVEQVMENDQLTDQQRLFCLYQSRMFNYTKAYQKAYPGCPYASAAVLGSRLMKNPVIRKEIEQLKQNRLNREMLDESDIFQKYMDIAFADMTDYAEFGNETYQDPDTGKELKYSFVHLKDSDAVDGTLISEVSKGKDGAKIKLLDKMKAMQWLTDHMNIATNEQRAKIELLKAQRDKLTGNNQEIEDLDDIEDEIYGGEG
ncbi:MAG TPA: terminase small subunit [Candidatus Anaerostipes excrementavium]|uniref:Terminase small subunit n=1 Tax=Candidatus Anaerostipes excrementavium TaxID=2838463 RepID=A0A9D2B9W2_9FIRM|nr:terminase small subunit [Candidatus Anaerostipes excrementavium]